MVLGLLRDCRHIPYGPCFGRTAMTDEKPRKPLYGAKGPLPGGAGRYSLSSRPPKPSEAALGATVDSAPVEIPGPSRVPQEAIVTQGESVSPPEVAPSPAPGVIPSPPTEAGPVPKPSPTRVVSVAPDAWKGSTVGGMGQAPRVPAGRNNDFKTTLALGSAPLREFLEQKEEFAPGTIRGTPPPARPGTSYPPGPTQGFESGAGPSVNPRTGSTIPPDSPKTERATVPPADARRSSVRLFDVESIRAASHVSTALHPDLLAICEDIGQSCATEAEVALLGAPKESRDSLYASAVAIARRLGQVLPGEVVLVETDFESPGLAQTLGVTLPRGRGFSEQLHARAWSASASNLILTNPGLGFDALFEGRLRTPGLLWSDQFASVIATLRHSYSVILLVAPSRLTAVDHRALSDVVDSAYVLHAEDDPQGASYLRIGPLTQKVKRAVSLQGIHVRKKRRSFLRPF